MGQSISTREKLFILELAISRSEYKEERRPVKEIYKEMLTLIVNEE